MTELETSRFDPVAFLAKAGPGRTVLHIEPKATFFLQGTSADNVFYIQEGRAKLTVVSGEGKEATVALLTAGNFVGDEAIVAAPGLRAATARAITSCKVLKIERAEMIRVLHEEPAFSDLFVAFMVARSMQAHTDLVDRLFNSSEKRLARVLLLMAESGAAHTSGTLIAQITQEDLARMVGTTPSRISFFMNRFRDLGFIEYDGRIRVHTVLLNGLLDEPSARKLPLGI
jgi:CRP/FNR family cyclic AMP-dependent transcriptional regulator